MNIDEVTYPQCFSCNQPPNVREFVEELVRQKAGYAGISRQLLEVFDVSISPDAVSNHVRNHLKAPEYVLSPEEETEKVEIDTNGEGYVTTRGYAEPKLITDTSQMLENAGLDPNSFEVVGNMGVSTWNAAAYNKATEQWEKTKLYSYRIKVRLKGSPEEKIDLPALFAESRQDVSKLKVPASPTHRDTDRSLVVVFADAQVGKSGSRGGTSELLSRIESIRTKLRHHMANTSATEAVFIDDGDIVENFENTAQQHHTNDLSLMDQLDLAGTIEENLIMDVAANFSKVRVAGVPSNHGAWRRGKDYLGKPSDDYGLFILKQIQKAFKHNPGLGHVEFHYPGAWDKTLCLDVHGIGLGLAHGDDVNNPDQMPKWWAGQVHGSSPMAQADIAVTGHFHHLRVQPTGRSIKTGRQKWWIQAPTLDNGSDWFHHKSGEYSDPGLLVFEVDKNGLDLSSLTVLEGN